MNARVEHPGVLSKAPSTTLGIGTTAHQLGLFHVAVHGLAEWVWYLLPSSPENVLSVNLGTTDFSLHKMDVRAMRALVDMTCVSPMFVTTELDDDTAILGRPQSTRPMNLQIVAREEMVPMLFDDDFSDWENEIGP